MTLGVLSATCGSLRHFFALITSTMMTHPTVASEEAGNALITSLVYDSSDKFYCCGTEDGVVIMYSMDDGTKIRKLTSHSSGASIIKLGWSASEKYFASADDSGRVIVKRLSPPSIDAPRKWAVFAVCDIRLEDTVQQLLFSPKEEYLLMGSISTTSLISLKTKKMTCKIKRTSQEGEIWFPHPKDPTLLLSVSSAGEQAHEWSSLSPVELSVQSSMSRFSFGNPSIEIPRSIQLRNRWIVLESLMNPEHEHHRVTKRHFDVIDLSHVGSSMANSASPRQTILGLEHHIECLIGSFRDQVVFLDRQFWLCTWELERTHTKHKRHFFLPKDWINPLALGIIALNEHGTLLCPKNGEVAVIRGGLKL